MAIDKAKLDIFNMALKRIGAVAVASVDENSKNARDCRSFFDLSRDYVLREYAWKFASKRMELAKDTTKPVFQWASQFHLPSDCLRVLRMQEPGMQWRVEGDFLVTNETAAKILYTKRVLNIGEFDPMACKVLVLELANNIAPSIIGSKAEKKQDQIQKELTKKVLPDAKKANAFEEIVPAERRENSGSWATARFVGTIPPNF